MTAFDDMVDAVFADANLGVDALYTPAVGPSRTVRVVRRSPDEEMGVLGIDVVTGTNLIEVRASEIAEPAQGDRFTLGGTVHVIQGKPKADADRRVWTVALAPE